MRFQIQQHEGFFVACDDCELCQEGDAGECLAPSFTPGMLYAKDIVDVAADGGSIANTVLGAVVSSSVYGGENLSADNVFHGDSDGDAGDRYVYAGEMSGTIFDVCDEDGRCLYVATRLSE